MVSKYLTNLARALLGKPYESLSERQQRVIESIASGEPVAENVNDVFEEQSTFWNGLADTLARVIGSWPFIFGFMAFLLAWMGLNTLILLSRAFDPYPYILLNLALSSIAALQAPVIMMSQNRQTEKDRIAQANAFEVNLKTELAIQQLHGKIDRLLASESSEAPAEHNR